MYGEQSRHEGAGRKNGRVPVASLHPRLLQYREGCGRFRNRRKRGREVSPEMERAIYRRADGGEAAATHVHVRWCFRHRSLR